VACKVLVLGLQHFNAVDLRAVKTPREQLRIRVLGLATIAHVVTPDLALATIASIEVLGAPHASAAAKVALADRIH
jgi:hypothetical protein